MKRNLFVSMMFALLASVLLAPAAGVAAGTLFGGLGLSSLLPSNVAGAAMAGVYKVVWTKEVLKRMSSLGDAAFLDGIKDYSVHVKDVGDEAQVIHATYLECCRMF